MKEIYIVLRPDMNADVSLGGVFSNLEAAQKCATDPNAEYKGYLWTIDLSLVKDEYVSEFLEDDEDD